jgi:hypothetical protein
VEIGFESLAEVGAIIGSGGLSILDETYAWSTFQVLYGIPSERKLWKVYPLQGRNTKNA